MIDLEAPDDVVLEALPDCETLDDGAPIRRAKIGYLLSQSGADYESLRDFVETDVDDVMKLFRVFNDATHGDAWVLDLNALRALKQRVEGAIKFRPRSCAQPPRRVPLAPGTRLGMVAGTLMLQPGARSAAASRRCRFRVKAQLIGPWRLVPTSVRKSPRSGGKDVGSVPAWG